MGLKERIIEALCKDKSMPKEVIEALRQSSSSNKSIKSILIEKAGFSEKDFLVLISNVLGIPYLDIGKFSFPEENASFIPEEAAFKYKIFPISKIKNVLTLATANPLDVVVFDDIKMKLDVDVELVLSKEEDILAALNRLYKKEESISSIIEEADLNAEIVGNEDLSIQGYDLIAESEKAPIVKIVDLIIYEGLTKRASDIHIEPAETSLQVRYRIDGVLHKALEVPKQNQNAILARLKIMSNIDITESKIPQDGRFKVRIQGREVDFRVSSLPTKYGEKFVLRALDKSNLSIGLEKLGFSPYPKKVFEEAIKKPFGIILVTGPTGSGKSTTLYSVINSLNKPDRHIITIEDPVEYQLEGITQIQVHPEIGLTFSSALRSVLRQSPDIIMVGEIRDSETADIAIKASLTGEMIFSTLHTNDSVGAITRLVDMGIEPFLVASSLILTSAQRLCRKICEKCKEPYTKVPSYLREKLGLDSKVTLFRGKGCPACSNTGYKGREAILEVLPVDDKIKEMIIKREPESSIIKYAREEFGFKSLREDGIYKCINGVTTPEEVLRVT
ncbi:secretion system protein E [bacterium]|nr:MAG: secretion system protein E [bacterium]